MYWDVTHSCGHSERHLIVATFAYQADAKALQLKRRWCTACYRADKQAKAGDQAAADAAATLAALTLPALTGSEKQVAWAERIRRERLAAAFRKAPNVAAHFFELTEAKWWIDNRSTDLAVILARRKATTS